MGLRQLCIQHARTCWASQTPRAGSGGIGWSLLILLGTYLFVYPWGILLIALDIVPAWGTWMGGALLIVQGTLMGLWLVANYGRRGGLAALAILLISWAVEHIGVTTGFPFGSYTYTDALNLKVLGVVPLAVPFAWLLVIPTAFSITTYLMRRAGFSRLLAVLGTASFAMLLDLLIEPVAVHINGYWVWNDAGSYYGIPGANFVAWWVTSAGLAWLLLVLTQPVTGIHPRATDLRIGVYLWLPPLLYMLNLTMFVLITLAHGKLLAVAIGGGLLLYLGLAWAEPRLVCWIMGESQSSAAAPDQTPG